MHIQVFITFCVYTATILRGCQRSQCQSNFRGTVVITTSVALVNFPDLALRSLVGFYIIQATVLFREK